MSLDDAQRRRTSDELRRNADLCGLTHGAMAADLGFTTDHLREVVALSGPQDPVDVWLLRDYLEQAVRDAGRDPEPFTVLTPASRRMARMWFRLRPAPRHMFAA
ncbi:DUF2316 family protein [Streptomyces sp. SID6673]|nr:DUF2316 family protein [Streptomyces sp. SID11726]NEB26518.1 DUF2316 family protein [Streptomyces sp. SID6673]